MGLSKNFYMGVLKIKEITSRRYFKYSLMTIGVFFLFFITLNAYAQGDEGIEPDWSGTKEFFNTVSGVEEAERATQDNVTTAGGTQVMNVAWSGVTLFAPEVSPSYQALLNNPNIPKDLKAGLIGLTTGASDSLYANYPIINIPVHFAEQWVPGYKDSTTSLYAQQESGYDHLKNSNINLLWSKTLNISYVIFVLIMIAAGFMIMFRNKLGGQTMVTLANVLPKVIISLVVATFSFAIAGFIIDLGGILISTISTLFFEAGSAQSIAGLGRIMNTAITTPAGIGTGLAGATSGVVGALGLKAAVTGVAFLGLGPIAAGIIGGVGILAMIVLLGILGIIFTGALRVLITLFKAYFQLLIAVILGPIQITLGALPGSSPAIKNWFLSVLRNVLVFPVVFTIINIPNALVAAGDLSIGFPGKLVNLDPASYNPDPITVEGGLFLWIFKIFMLFFAAQAPKFLEKWFPPDSSKAMGEGFGNAKASMSKLPVIGSMFK